MGSLFYKARGRQLFDFIFLFMCFADYISNCDNIVSLVSIACTLIIGILQIIQNYRMNKYVMKYNDMDRIRYESLLDSDVNKFIFDNIDSRDLFVLCTVAFAYRSVEQKYTKKLYNEFVLLSDDVRDRLCVRLIIPKYCDLGGSAFYSTCKIKIEYVTETMLSEYICSRLYYDDFKYLYRSLYYGSKPIDTRIDTVEFGNEIYMLFISPYSRNLDFDCIIEKYSFCFEEEVLLCQFVCLFIYHIAIYAGDIECVERDTYVGAKDICLSFANTIEDLFLITLYEVWNNLFTIKL